MAMVILSAFLAYLRANRGLSNNTVKAYGTDVRECLHALASRGIADLRQVTTDDLRGWMAFETRDHARSSMARKEPCRSVRFSLGRMSMAGSRPTRRPC